MLHAQDIIVVLCLVQDRRFSIILQLLEKSEARTRIYI